MKEVEEAVIDRAQSNTEFINIVAQVVGFGSTKFVTKEGESGNGRTAFVEGSGIGLIEGPQPPNHR